ncbi:UDP-N-acetylmuramate--L-alanine ligase [Pontiella sulfatireligans]|uniref:UDP-N-acetylmuramate--L-alanine ligase n=1 Tax=Pontiella sulfatireligans TaxID=2750658 RepID=A0A6C2UTK1_9BACT|nr:Mur ligase domain-containing protein [Pontiella sulfatireligans]VGO23293.1 UDP-N-acetylmuramate--L-alanine ligase [Pontiella sulfatireligans]
MNPVDQAELLIGQGGRVHLMGIGGIGMSGVAWLLKARGFFVSGCDLQGNRQTQWLLKNGISIAAGHHESHVDKNVDWLIRSTAVPDFHPEVRRALELGIPVSRRGEVLPALMRARTCIAVSGTHGKTTTTAVLAQVLGCGYCVGGEIAGIEGVAQDGEIMVVEADESDGTVAGYTPDYAVITNIEYDHMEHHDSEEAFVGCFDRLIANTKQTVFYCGADPIASKLCSGNPKCKPYCFPESRLSLPLPGNHNQWNASAAMAVAKLWKPEQEIVQALETLKPIRRRFETVFESGGVRIVSDYAHHPTEIAALIQTALELKPKRLLGVFQPHRYTRTLALGPDFPSSFQGVEKLWLAPVYAASESPLEGGTSPDLARRFPSDWNGRLIECPSLGTAWADIQLELREGDLLLIIGAGDIEQIADWARG